MSGEQARIVNTPRSPRAFVPWIPSLTVTSKLWLAPVQRSLSFPGQALAGVAATAHSEAATRSAASSREIPATVLPVIAPSPHRLQHTDYWCDTDFWCAGPPQPEIRSAQRSQEGPTEKIAATARPETSSAPARRVCVKANAANHSGQTGKPRGGRSGRGRSQGLERAQQQRQPAERGQRGPGQRAHDHTGDDREIERRPSTPR